MRLFASNDRATRVQLLHHLPSYVDKLSDEVINTSVLTHVATGFSDTNAVSDDDFDPVKGACFAATADHHFQ